MNVTETIALLQELKRSGASHFKSQDFEVTMAATMHEPLSIPPPVVKPAHAEPLSQPVENAEATEKLKNLIETLKMDDNSLVDRIFPAGAGG